MRRVVFDANVWVSAFLYAGSVPSQAVGHARERRVQAVISEALIDQVLRALARLGYPPDAVAEAEVEIRQLSVVINPSLRLSVITAKASDNRVLECAVEGRADLIVTGDRKHLLPLGAYHGIPIVSPRDFLSSAASGT